MVLFTVLVQAVLVAGVGARLFQELPGGARQAVIGALRAETPGTGRPLLRAFRPVVATSLLVSTLASIAVAVTVARRLSRPLEDLAVTARRIAGGDLSARAPNSVGDREVSRLIADVNLMAAWLEHAEQERRYEAAAIAHELRTPLTALHARVDSIADGLYPLTADEVRKLRGPLEILGKLAEDLRVLTLAEAGQLRLQPVRTLVQDLLQEAVSSVEALAARQNLIIEVTCLSDRGTRCDPLRTRQILVNLLENALRHARSRVSISAQRTEDEVTITVRDDGPGTGTEHLRQVFQRFYRTDASRARDAGGSGLGLSVVKALVEAQGGTVEARLPGTGFEVCVTLPFSARS